MDPTCWRLMIASGKHTKSYRKLSFIVSFPIKKIVVFHSYVMQFSRGSFLNWKYWPKMCTFQSRNIRIWSIAFPTVTVVQNLLIFYVDIFWYGTRPGTPQNKGWCKIFSSQPMPITVHVRFTPDHSRATSFGWRRCDIAPLR